MVHRSLFFERESGDTSTAGSGGKGIVARQ